MCCGLRAGGVIISKSKKSAVWGRCSTRVRSGPHANRQEMHLDRIETDIFNALRCKLEGPAFICAELHADHEERQKFRTTARQNCNELTRAATQVRNAHDRAHRLYTQGPRTGLRRRLRSAASSMPHAQPRPWRPRPTLLTEQSNYTLQRSTDRSLRSATLDRTRRKTLRVGLRWCKLFARSSDGES
jgi:hypothetical protein